jgi:hypothetical protein
MRAGQIFPAVAVLTAATATNFELPGIAPRSSYVVPEDGTGAGLLSHESHRYSSKNIKRDNSIPIIITNQCSETIWPALASQAGTGPDTGGFELATGNSMNLTVSEDWQGRIWGRTNCSFNANGTGPSNLNGNNGAGTACGTGDCNGVLSCVVTVSVAFQQFDVYY